MAAGAPDDHATFRGRDVPVAGGSPYAGRTFCGLTRNVSGHFSVLEHGTSPRSDATSYLTADPVRMEHNPESPITVDQFADAVWSPSRTPATTTLIV
jgi:hypothetical protein